jgi:predicted nucleotidyltransferase component of viral defense system
VNGKTPKNLAASIRQRLTNVARETGRPFDELLQYYAMERFLYRLSRSTHADKFVLKGALMLAAWGVAETRPTRDIDLLGHLSNRVEDLVSVLREVCGQEVEPDAMVFDVASMKGFVIKEDADYEGVRVTFRGTLQNMRIPMQIDIGFGDIVFPAALVTAYPTILNHSAPMLRAYSRETVIAEKFEAMVKLGPLNSRMKDFYDIWLLARHFDFEGTTLAESIAKTFAHRGTTITADPTAFSDEFATDPTKNTQWRAFVRKSRLAHAPEEFPGTVESVTTFLKPLAVHASQGRSFSKLWRAPGPWT